MKKIFIDEKGHEVPTLNILAVSPHHNCAEGHNKREHPSFRTLPTPTTLQLSSCGDRHVRRPYARVKKQFI
jgi:hypothetical protein